jgi:hypothetical protein
LVFGITYTEKELKCEWEGKLTDTHLTHTPALLPVLVDSQGVYTVRDVKPSTEYPNDGKIEYCRLCRFGFCYKGAVMYWALNFHEKCDG